MAGAGDTNRRGVLGVVTGWLAAAAGAVVAVPGLGFLASPLRRDSVRGARTPLRVASVADVKPGRPLACEVRGDLVDGWSRLPGVKLGSCWLIKEEADSKVRAFSTVCPHLGCSVEFDEARSRFACPCHHSLFALDGKLVSGPSPRDLDELELIAEGPELKVVYRRFRVGVSRKVEA